MATSMPRRRSWRLARLWHAGVLAAIVAVALNVVIYLSADALGASFVVQPPNREPSEVTAGGVVVLTAVPLIIATVVYGVLRRFTRQAFRVFVVLALVVFLILLIPPLGAAPELSTAAALILMHVVATGSILGALALFERSTFPGT
ncbi:DUF6069 family protein [Thermomicrobiaceae bacterium CFH 74404]|uniref:DUF6069 family protein n=1 Tax=Thermalbibacter longus TaxID=2951981 RepID=A0AA41WBH1_9BACT|nr:DUF6069 family protein [Thermalbibacter longus]MCM8749622.1 DUF6069 family protein [Thermalbibacter longus]